MQERQKRLRYVGIGFFGLVKKRGVAPHKKHVASRRESNQIIFPPDPGQVDQPDYCHR
jgi:hypothetical protein